MRPKTGWPVQDSGSAVDGGPLRHQPRLPGLPFSDHTWKRSVSRARLGLGSGENPAGCAESAELSGGGGQQSWRAGTPPGEEKTVMGSTWHLRWAVTQRAHRWLFPWGWGSLWAAVLTLSYAGLGPSLGGVGSHC